MAGKSYSVSVSGLSELSKVPGWLEHAQRDHLENAAKRVAEAIGKAAPRRGGKLEASWRSRTISAVKAVIFSTSEYAKAQDRGAYITPKKGKFLRFNVDGQERFAKAVRLPATKYTQKGLRSKGKIIRDEYERAFDDISKVG